MAYVRTTLSGLGIDPATAVMVTKFGYSGLKKLFGTKPPEKPLPYRFDRPGRGVGDTGFPNLKPGYLGIVYCGSKADGAGFHRIWEGSVYEIFDQPGFEISGTIDGGKRAYHACVKGGRLTIVEDFGQGWVQTRMPNNQPNNWTRQELIDWTHHVAHGVVGPITRPAVAVTAPAAVAAGRMPTVAAGFAPDLGGATMPLLIAAGLGLVFMLKR